MSAARMSHEQLEGFAARLAELRDEEAADEAKYPASAEVCRARASAYRLALSSLHAWSDGAYGEPYPQAEQEAGAPTRGPMTELNEEAREELRTAGISLAAWARVNGYQDGRWHGDACGCPDSRCIGHHHDEDDDCGCLRTLLADHQLWGELR